MALLKNLAESLAKRVIPDVAERLFPTPFQTVATFKENLDKAEKPFNELKESSTSLFTAFGGMRPALKNLSKQARTGKFGLSKEDRDNIGMEEMMGDMGGEDGGGLGDLDSLLNDMGGDGGDSSSSNIESTDSMDSISDDDPIGSSSMINNNHTNIINNNTVNSLARSGARSIRSVSAGEGLISEKVDYQTVVSVAQSQQMLEINSNINKSLEMLATFQAEQTMEHYRQSEEYFKLSSDYNSHMRENYELIFDHYRREKERKEEAEKNKGFKTKEFDLDTMLSPERLMKKVMDSPVGMIMGEQGAGMIKGEMQKFTQDPLGTLVTIGLTSLSENVFKKQIDSINSFVEELPFKLQSIFTRWSKNADGDGFMNKLLGVVGNFLKIDLGTPTMKLNKIEEGKVDFDGKTRDMIIRGIPMYLAQIAYNTLMTSQILARSNIIDSTKVKKKFVLNTSDANKNKNYSLYNPDSGIMEGSKKKVTAVKKEIEDIRNNNAGVGDEAKAFASSAGASKASSAFFAKNMMRLGRGGDATVFDPTNKETYLSNRATREEYIKNNSDKKRIDRSIYDENFFNNVIAQPEFKSSLLNIQIENLLSKINVPDNVKDAIREELLKSAKSGKFHELNFDKLFSNTQLASLGVDDRVNSEISNYTYNNKENITDLIDEGIKFNTDSISVDNAKFTEAKAKSLQDKDLRGAIKKLVDKADLKGPLKKELENELFSKAVAENGNLTADMIKEVVTKVSKKDTSFTLDANARDDERVNGVLNNTAELNASIDIIRNKLSSEAIAAQGIDAGAVTRGVALNSTDFVDIPGIHEQVKMYASEEGGKEHLNNVINSANRLQYEDVKRMNELSNANIEADGGTQGMAMGLTGRKINTNLDSRSFVDTKTAKLGSFKDLFSNLFGKISNMFDGFFKGISDMFGNMFNSLKNMFKDFSFKMFSLPQFKLKWKGFKKKVAGDKDFGEKVDADGNPIDDGIVDALKVRAAPTINRVKDKIAELLKFNPKDENGEYKNIGTILAESVQVGINRVSQSLRDWLTGEDNTQKTLGESLRIKFDDTLNRFKAYLLGTDDKELAKNTSLIAAARVKLDDLFGKRLKLAIFGPGTDKLSLIDNIKASVNKATSKISDFILGSDHANRKGEEGMSVFKAISIRASSTMDKFKDLLTGGVKNENGERPSIFSALSLGINKAVFGDKNNNKSLWENIKVTLNDKISVPLSRAILGSQSNEDKFKDLGIIGAAGQRLNKWMFGDDKSKEAGILANIGNTLGRFVDVAIFGKDAADRGQGLWSNVQKTFKSFTDDIGRRFSEGVWEPTKSYFKDLLGPTVKEMFSTLKDEAKHYLALSKDWFSGDFLARTEGFMGRVFGDDVAKLFRENIVVPIKKLTEVLTDSLSKVMKFLFKLPINFMRGITDTVKLKRLKEGRGNYSDEEKARLLALDKKGSTFDFNRNYDDNKKLGDDYKAKKAAENPQVVADSVTDPVVSQTPSEIVAENTATVQTNVENNTDNNDNTPTPQVVTPPKPVVSVVPVTPSQMIANATGNRTTTPVAPVLDPINPNVPVANTPAPVITPPTPAPINTVNPTPAITPSLPGLGDSSPIGRVVGSLKGADLADLARNSTIDLLQQQKIATASTETAASLVRILDHTASIDSKVQGGGGMTVDGKRSSSTFDKIGNLITAPFKALLTVGSGLASGVVKLAKLPAKALSAIGSGIANIGAGLLNVVPAITKSAGKLITNLGKIGATLFDGLGTVATTLTEGAIKAGEGLFKFGAAVAGPALTAVGGLVESLVKGLAPAAEALGKGISVAVEGLLKFGTILLDKGLQGALFALEKGAKLLGFTFSSKGKNPFASSSNNVTNWNELLLASKASPLHVYVTDGKIQTYRKDKRVAKTGLNNADVLVNPLGDEKKKDDKDENSSGALGGALGALAGTTIGGVIAGKLASMRAGVAGFFGRKKDAAIDAAKNTGVGKKVTALGEALKGRSAKESIRAARANVAAGTATDADRKLVERLEARKTFKANRLAGIPNDPVAAPKKVGMLERFKNGVTDRATRVKAVFAKPELVGPPRPANLIAEATNNTSSSSLRENLSSIKDRFKDKFTRTPKPELVGPPKQNAYDKTISKAKDRVKAGTATKSEIKLVRRHNITERGKSYKTTLDTVKDKVSNAKSIVYDSVGKAKTKVSDKIGKVKTKVSDKIGTAKASVKKIGLRTYNGVQGKLIEGKELLDAGKTKVKAGGKFVRNEAIMAKRAVVKGGSYVGSKAIAAKDVVVSGGKLAAEAVGNKVSGVTTAIANSKVGQAVGSKAAVFKDNAVAGTKLLGEKAVAIKDTVASNASKGVSTVSKFTKGKLGIVGKAIGSTVAAAPSAIFNTVGNNAVSRGIVGAGQAVGAAGSSLVGGVTNAAKTVMTPGVVSGAATNAGSAIATGASKVGSTISTTASNVGTKVAGAAASVGEGVSKVGSRLMDAKKGVNFKMKGGGIAGIAAALGGSYLIDKFTDKGSFANEASSKALEYAGWGGMLGSVLPGVGNALGAGLGAVAGVLHATLNKAVDWVESTFGEEITSATQGFLEFPKKLELWVEELPLKIDQFAKDLPEMIMNLFASGDEASALENPDVPVGKPSILGSLFKAFGKAVVALIENLPSIALSVLKGIPKLVLGLAGGVVGLVFKGISGAVTFITDGVYDIAFGIVSKITGGIKKAFGVFTSITDGVSNFAGNIKDFVFGMYGGLYDIIKTVAGWLPGGEYIVEAMDTVKDAVTGVVKGISDVFTSIVDGIKGIVNGVFDSIRKAATAIIEWIPGGKALLGTISQFTSPTDKDGKPQEGVLAKLTRYVPGGNAVVDAVKYSGLSEAEKVAYNSKEKQDRLDRDKLRKENIKDAVKGATGNLIDYTDKMQSATAYGGNMGTAQGADLTKIAELTKSMDKFAGTMTSAVNADTSMKAGSADVNKTIDRIADKYGIEKGLFHHMAMVESSKDPNANRNSASVYKGLFQIGANHLTDKTVVGGVVPDGADVKSYGLREVDLYNPQVNAEIAAKMMRSNTVALKASGVPINPTMLYVAHQQGAAGAIDIYKSAMAGTPPKLNSTARNIANNIPAVAKAVVNSPAKFLEMWDTIVQTGKTAGEGAKAYFAKVSGKTDGATAGTAPSGATWNAARTAPSGSSGYTSTATPPTAAPINSTTPVAQTVNVPTPQVAKPVVNTAKVDEVKKEAIDSNYSNEGRYSKPIATPVVNTAKVEEVKQANNEPYTANLVNITTMKEEDRLAYKKATNTNDIDGMFKILAKYSKSTPATASGVAPTIAPAEIPKVSASVGSFNTSNALKDKVQSLAETQPNVAKQTTDGQVLKNADAVNAAKMEEEYRKAGYTGNMLASGMDAKAASSEAETINLIEELRKQTSYLAKIVDNTLDSGNMFNELNTNISNAVTNNGTNEDSGSSNTNILNMNSKQTNVQRLNSGKRYNGSMKPSENAYYLASGGSTTR